MHDLDIRIEQLIKARDLIDDAVDLITLATQGTQNEPNVQAQICAHLTNWAHATHTLETTIPRLIEQLHKEAIKKDDEE